MGKMAMQVRYAKVVKILIGGAGEMEIFGQFGGALRDEEILLHRLSTHS